MFIHRKLELEVQLMNRIPMTIRGAEKLREELIYLKNIRRPEIIKSIIEARQHGDLKENAEYHSAREQQSFCESRIQEIETKLSNAQIIDVTKFILNGKVIFGSTINIENLDLKKKQTYCIVGADEANFKDKLISINSPIARAFIGKTEGDIVFVDTPSGTVKYKILKVEYL